MDLEQQLDGVVSTCNSEPSLSSVLEEWMAWRHATQGESKPFAMMARWTGCRSHRRRSSAEADDCELQHRRRSKHRRQRAVGPW